MSGSRAIGDRGEGDDRHRARLLPHAARQHFGAGADNHRRSYAVVTTVIGSGLRRRGAHAAGRQGEQRWRRRSARERSRRTRASDYSKTRPRLRRPGAPGGNISLRLGEKVRAGGAAGALASVPEPCARRPARARVGRGRRREGRKRRPEEPEPRVELGLGRAEDKNLRRAQRGHRLSGRRRGRRRRHRRAVGRTAGTRKARRRREHPLRAPGRRPDRLRRPTHPALLRQLHERDRDDARQLGLAPRLACRARRHRWAGSPSSSSPRTRRRAGAASP